MSLEQLLFGFFELLISALISFVLIFATYRVILAVTRRFDEENQLKRGNAAVGIVLGGILVGEVLVVRQAIYPVMAVLQIFVMGGERSLPAFLKLAGLSVGYVFLAGVLAVLCILFSLWLFDRMTPGIEEYEEIKAGNIAVAVFMALLIVAVSILIGSGVSGLTKALVPFPEVGTVPIE